MAGFTPLSPLPKVDKTFCIRSISVYFLGVLSVKYHLAIAKIFKVKSLVVNRPLAVISFIPWNHVAHPLYHVSLAVGSPSSKHDTDVICRPGKSHYDGDVI